MKNSFRNKKNVLGTLVVLIALSILVLCIACATGWDLSINHISIPRTYLWSSPLVFILMMIWWLEVLADYDANGRI